jgi:type IV pilus biogenesis protein PilP
MRFKIFIAVIALNCMSSVFAQDVKLVDMLAEESKKTLAKQKEENSKLAPTTPVVALNQLTAPSMVKPKPINTEPRTISVYGVAPDYKAEMEINGKVLLVKTGQTIQNYKVASINSSGVTLLSTVNPKRKAKVRSKIAVNKPVDAVSTEPKKVATVKRKSPVNTTAAAPTVVSRFFALPQQ